MPPTSSPVPRLSSVPSAASTVHTTASRSPLTTSHHHRMKWRPPRPLLGDAIATTSQHLAADRPTTSSRAAPRRSAILPASSSFPSNPSGGEEGNSKRTNRTGRERTRVKDAAAIFASSSTLFCSVCCLHRPHHRQPLTTSPACVSAQGDGRAATSSASGRCYRHHIATTSPSTNNQQQGSASTVCHPARLVLFPVPSFRWRGRETQKSKQNRKRENQGEGCRRHLRPFFHSVFVCGSCYSSP